MSAEDEFERMIADADNQGIDLDSPGIKSLRKAYDKLKTETAQLRTQVQENAKVTRTTSLKSALDKYGAKPALARYFPNEGEVTEDSVLTWLKEDGELFGWQPPTETPETPTADLAAAALIASVRPTAPAPTDLTSRVNSLTVPSNSAEAAQVNQTLADLTNAFQARLAGG